MGHRGGGNFEIGIPFLFDLQLEYSFFFDGHRSHPSNLDMFDEDLEMVVLLSYTAVVAGELEYVVPCTMHYIFATVYAVNFIVSFAT